jgi:group I intron endonuclease
MGIIYKALNKSNGKIYIGQTKFALQKRVSQHLNDKRDKMPFVRALQKYGVETFEIEPVAWAYTKEHLDFLEKFYIDFFKSKPPNGYNIAEGGIGGCESEEVKQKISTTLKGQVIPVETRRKISASLKGKPRSEEHQKKLNESHGSMSLETRKKISTSHQGQRVSEETKQKISKTMKQKGIIPPWQKRRMGVS